MDAYKSHAVCAPIFLIPSFSFLCLLSRPAPIVRLSIQEIRAIINDNKHDQPASLTARLFVINVCTVCQGTHSSPDCKCANTTCHNDIRYAMSVFITSHHGAQQHDASSEWASSTSCSTNAGTIC